MRLSPQTLRDTTAGRSASSARQFVVSRPGQERNGRIASDLDSFAVSQNPRRIHALWNRLVLKKPGFPVVGCPGAEHLGVLTPMGRGKVSARFYHTDGGGKSWRAVAFRHRWNVLSLAMPRGAYELFGSENSKKSSKRPVSSLVIFSFSSDGANWKFWPRAPAEPFSFCSGFSCSADNGWIDFDTNPPRYSRPPPSGGAAMQTPWTTLGSVRCTRGAKLVCAPGTATEAAGLAARPAKEPASAKKACKLTVARRLRCGPPEYAGWAPWSARHGTTLFQILIARTGRVKDPARIYAPCRQMTQAALKALSRWRLRPAMRDGKAVPMDMGVEVAFKLNR